MEDPESLIALMRRHHLKVTPQRQCIVEILYANPRHSTAEAIFDLARGRMPTISLKTVYETLHSLASLGQVQQIDLGTRSIWFDPDVHRHHHLVCSGCGRIENAELDLDSLARAAATRHGFVLAHAEVILRGLCGTCATPDLSPAGSR